MNQVKINRAKMVAKCGQHALTWEANLAKVPVGVLQQCTAKTLAEVVDALNEQYEQGRTFGQFQNGEA